MLGSDRVHTSRIARRVSTTVEILEGRALLSTLYVDGHNTTGVQDGSALHPFSQIQAAIDHTASSGDTVSVAPGIYAENLTISHSLTLIGPNADVNPNTGSRGPEAVLIPAVDNANSGRMILVTGNDVTIEGLTIDGHNDALPQDTLLNGISSNAASGITNVDSAGTIAPISGLNVENNVIRNLTAFGVMADINDFSTPTLAVSTGNTISDNLIDNLPIVSPVPGRGISIEDNFYADVTGNVITRAGTGIQAIFMLDPNPSGAASRISGNTITEYAIGILVWNVDNDMPASFVVSDNTVSAISDPQTSPTNVGIELDRILHSTGVALTNNRVNGAYAGIEMDYTSSGQSAVVTGGTLTGNAYGVLLTNNDAPPGDVPAKAVQANLQGVTIQGSTLAGIQIADTLAASGSTVTLNVDGTTTVSGSPHGAVLAGPGAKLVESVKPVLNLTSTPPAQTTSTSATFAYSASDNITTANDLLVQYSLDNGPLTKTTGPINLSGLSVGAHTLLLQSTDQAGNVGSISYSWTVNKSTVVPPAPSKPALDAASDTGVSSKDGITADNTPTFTGTSTAGGTVTPYAGSTPLGTTVADSTGKWRFTVGGPGSLAASLADGKYAVTATVATTPGNPSAPSPAATVVIDTTAPLIQATRTPVANGSGWNNTKVVASYTASDALSGLSSPSTGTYTFSSEGIGQSHTFKVTDVAGNTASVTVGSVNIDLTPPALSVSASPSSITPANGRQVVVKISGKITDKLSGVGATATYTLSDSYGVISSSGTISVAADGSYSFNVTVPATISGNRTRKYTITVSDTDAAGNARSTSTSVSVPATHGLLTILGDLIQALENRSSSQPILPVLTLPDRFSNWTSAFNAAFPGNKLGQGKSLMWD